jgi:hypothetical protein
MATSSGGGTSGARSTIGICFFFSLKSAALKFLFLLPFYDSHNKPFDRSLRVNS